MKSKIFITDEGYGPIVRQAAILEELKLVFPNLDVTIQTESHLEILKKVIPNVKYSKKFNNVQWAKTPDGSPDNLKIKEYLNQYPALSNQFVLNEIDFEYDFFISDFVYEAFQIGNTNGIKSFGVCHFTWDWFFYKLFPPVINDTNLVNWMIKEASKAEILFFPPFTPSEILKCYKNKAKEIPFIVRKSRLVSIPIINKSYKILIIDSGSKVNNHAMKKLFSNLTSIPEFTFYLPEIEENQIIGENIVNIPKGEMLSDYIPYVDLVVGRGGFNTISECISSRIPMLLFSEHMNPEMNENILNMVGIGLASFVKLDQLVQNTTKVLVDLFDGEYDKMKRNMMLHDFETDGARVIAESIANSINPK